jgi:uncharacterized protein
MIRETILTTISPAGAVHIAPIGLIEEPGGWIVAPFHPSRTLDNLRAVPEVVANHTDDVRIFAGCLTERRAWPCVPADRVRPPRLAAALAHAEMKVVALDDDPERPRFHCRVVHGATHGPFQGFNRAQAAVVEAAILVSRLFMLPREKVEREIAYLEVAVTKTAGPAEREAWAWLMQAVRTYYASNATATAGAHIPASVPTNAAKST